MWMNVSMQLVAGMTISGRLMPSFSQSLKKASV